jgi:hypothetical protein
MMHPQQQVTSQPEAMLQQQQQQQQQQNSSLQSQQHSLLQHQQQQQQQSGQAGFLHQRRTGDKVHFCICCQAPIAIYGRLLPCLHAFCLTCATDMPKCFM